ncbi:MAG TPA: PAS domain S-box protein [bacterium]|nr:PAS domain S-box protein [bacterium]
MNASIRLLVIEDSKDDAEMLIIMLEQGGFKVDWKLVETPEAMRNALEKESWDIVISDYAMPRFSGMEALRLVHEKDQDLPFILISGTIGEDVAVAAMKAGAHDYIMKDNMSRLVPAVKRELKEAALRYEKKQTEEELRKSEEKHRLIVENAHDGIEITQHDRIIFSNPQFAKMLGYTLEELENLPFSSIYSEQALEQLYQRHKRREAGEPEPHQFETTMLKKDGTEIVVDIKYEIIDYNGAPATFAIIRDITKQKLAEAQIKKDLQLKEVLIREVHHRVNNNLNVICSLLNMQAKKISTTDEAVKAFKNSRDRIMAMAHVHHTLYQSQDYSQVDMKTYLQTLTSQLIKTHSFKRKICLKTQANDIILDVTKAIPTGLILNELITNAFKHAFPNGISGEIVVSLMLVEDGWIELTVADSGVGLPMDFDIEKTDSMGLQLVNLLINQIEGSLSVSTKKGTTFRIRFSKGGR